VIIGDFLDALKADLVTQYPDAEVLRGERTGKATARAVVCVFWSGNREVGNIVQVAEAQVTVRYWPVSPKVRDDAPSGVRDTTPLEEAGVALQAFLQTKQVAYRSTGVWFLRCTSVVPSYDPEEWGVEATITCQFKNPATLP
jgi:hypothetical protein